MTKHQAIIEWLQPYIESDVNANNGLSFENVTVTPGFRSVVPNAGDNLIGTDITGSKKKEYIFSFIICELFDQDGYDTNLASMEIGDNFNKWVDLQQKNRNYPDFGTNTKRYKVESLSNMADLALVENGSAKYMLTVRIEYWEF